MSSKLEVKLRLVPGQKTAESLLEIAEPAFGLRADYSVVSESFVCPDPQICLRDLREPFERTDSARRPPGRRFFLCNQFKNIFADVASGDFFFD